MEGIISEAKVRRGHKKLNPRDIVGRQINKLKIIEYLGKDRYHRYLCSCECGNKIKILRNSLIIKTPQNSCGCIREYPRGDKSPGYKHGKSVSRAYSSWMGMKARCYNPNSKKFKNYGGRGITVCQEWQTFIGFYSDMGDPLDGMSLDRIDVNGNYSKENCRWATQKTQQNNRRDNRIIEAFGKTLPVGEWAKIYKIEAKIIRQRIDRDGLSPELALTMKKKNKK